MGVLSWGVMTWIRFNIYNVKLVLLGKIYKTLDKLDQIQANHIQNQFIIFNSILNEFYNIKKIFSSQIEGCLHPRKLSKLFICWKSE